MADSVEIQAVQATNAKRIAEHFVEVRRQLHGTVNEPDLDMVAATLTAALWSTD